MSATCRMSTWRHHHEQQQLAECHNVNIRHTEDSLWCCLTVFPYGNIPEWRAHTCVTVTRDGHARLILDNLKCSIWGDARGIPICSDAHINTSAAQESSLSSLLSVSADSRHCSVDEGNDRGRVYCNWISEGDPLHGTLSDVCDYSDAICNRWTPIHHVTLPET